MPFTLMVRPSKFEQPQPVMGSVTRRHTPLILLNGPLDPPLTSRAGLHGVFAGAPALPKGAPAIPPFAEPPFAEPPFAEPPFAEPPFAEPALPPTAL